MAGGGFVEGEKGSGPQKRCARDEAWRRVEWVEEGSKKKKKEKKREREREREEGDMTLREKEIN